jgi:hypothetical protein
METKDDTPSLEPIDESKVVLQLVVEALESGPRATFKSAVTTTTPRAGLIYGAALSTLLSSITGAARYMSEHDAKCFYDAIERAIEHGGDNRYIKIFYRMCINDIEGLEEGGCDPNQPRRNG